MDPVFRRLSDEGALTSACTWVPADRMSSCTNEVIELGQLDNESIPIILIERSFLKVFLYESGLELKTCLFLWLRVSDIERHVPDCIHTYIMFLYPRLVQEFGSAIRQLYF